MGGAANYHRAVTQTQRPLTHELRFAQVASGARIAWARSGRVGGPVLLRAAHWMTHVDHDLRSALWRPLIERLGRSFELVRYDERGCGLSAGEEVPLGIATSVEELEVVSRAHGAERFALLGISGGAGAAPAFAARHPERVSHLVLLAGFSHGLLHREISAQTLAFHDAQLRLIELGWGRKDPGVQHMFTSRFMPEATAEQAASFNEHQRLSCDGLRAAAIVRARASQDVRPLLAAVQAPPPALTAGERALAGLVGQGLDNLQIAARLGLADKTVRNRLSALYGKLGVEGRAMAVVKARDLGL